jgi:hypothetical protein
MAYNPWVCKTFRVDTYWHPVYGECSKLVFTLRNDVYFQDGTQLSIADIYFTFVELKKDLANRGLAPPWWISNVQDILSFCILDPLNFEVLLDVKSMFAIDWIGQNRILPKHIWKPIVTGAQAPKSGVAWDPTTFAPDPNLIGLGPWRLDEYVAGSHVLLVANKPSYTVDTDIKCLDPNADSVPIHNPKGYFRLKPKYIDIHADNYRAKILAVESVPACNPQKWNWINLTATDHNLWLEQFNFTFTGPPTNPIGQEIALTGPEPLGCVWQIVNWVDQTPNGVLDTCDIIEVKPIAPPPLPPVPPDVTVWFHVQWLNQTTHTLHVGQCIITDKYVYVDGNLISRVTATNAGGITWVIDGKVYEFRGWIHDTAPPGLSPSDKIIMLRLDPLPITYEYFHVIEYTPTLMILDPVEVEKPCIPIVETFTVNLTKCFHTVLLSKYFETEWFLCPNNILQHYPYDPWINVTWPIWVTIKQDIAGSYYINTQLPAPDCKVDLKDVYASGKAFGSVPGDAKWNTVADINGDYKVDLKDYFPECQKFGKW